jgi:dynein heavy chain
MIYLQVLKAIAEVWENMPLELVPHKQGIYRLKTVDDILQTLEDHQMQLGTMKSQK